MTDAIDKGDNRRLGKKPIFSSSQVTTVIPQSPFFEKHFVRAKTRNRSIYFRNFYLTNDVNPGGYFSSNKAMCVCDYSLWPSDAICHK